MKGFTFGKNFWTSSLNDCHQNNLWHNSSFLLFFSELGIRIESLDKFYTWWNAQVSIWQLCRQLIFSHEVMLKYFLKLNSLIGFHHQQHSDQILRLF